MSGQVIGRSSTAFCAWLANSAPRMGPESGAPAWNGAARLDGVVVDSEVGTIRQLEDVLISPVHPEMENPPTAVPLTVGSSGYPLAWKVELW